MNLAYINKIKPLNGRKEVDVYIDNLQRPLSPYSYDYTASFLKDDAGDSNYMDITTNENRAIQRCNDIRGSKGNSGSTNTTQELLPKQRA